MDHEIRYNSNLLKFVASDAFTSSRHDVNGFVLFNDWTGMAIGGKALECRDMTLYSFFSNNDSLTDIERARRLVDGLVRARKVLGMKEMVIAAKCGNDHTIDKIKRNDIYGCEVRYEYTDLFNKMRDEKDQDILPISVSSNIVSSIPLEKPPGNNTPFYKGWIIGAASVLLVGLLKK